MITQATERSVTLRSPVETIDHTQGLVYVNEGRCGHSVRACLMLSVTVAGTHRVLRILVDIRREPLELMQPLGTNYGMPSRS